MTIERAEFALDLLADGLEGRRWPADSETRLQAALAEWLGSGTHPFQAEVRLDPRSRIDFIVWRDGVEQRIGIETKIGGGRLAIWRQCQRYTRHQAIDALILLGTVAMPQGLRECEGKPFRFVSIGKAWL